MEIDIPKLNKMFAHDVTKCLRCNNICNMSIKPCIDANNAYDYGEQIYIECPKCKEENIFPWSSFLIIPPDFTLETKFI